MSRWRTERLHVDLRPDAVTLVRGRRTLFGGQRVTASESFAAMPAASDEAPWRPALAALHAALGDAAGRARATVVLSSRFVRHALVPWSDAVADADEAHALARHAFERIYGDAAAAWELRIDPGRPGAPRLASAVDAGLLTALRGTFDAAHIRLDSIQPELMAVYNRQRGRLGRRHAWLALVEPGSLVLALLRRGRWLRVRTLRVGPAWRVELARILEREAFLVEPDAVATEVFLWTAGVGDANLPENDRWRFHLLAAEAPVPAAPEPTPAEA